MYTNKKDIPNFRVLTYSCEKTSYVSRLEASNSVTDSSELSNPADAQNVSCLGLCGKDICPKSSA